MNDYWALNYSRRLLSDQSDLLISECIESFANNELIKIDNFNLSIKDIDLLTRWPLYLSINTFLERLIRLTVTKEIPTKNKNFLNLSYYKNSSSLSVNIYNNVNLNNYLMNKLIDIIQQDYVNDIHVNEVFNNNTNLLKKNYSLQGLKNFLQRLRILIKIKTRFSNKNLNIKYLFENNIWLKEVFDSPNILPEIEPVNFSIDKNKRLMLRNELSKIFYKYLKDHNLFSKQYDEK